MVLTDLGETNRDWTSRIIEAKVCSGDRSEGSVFIQINDGARKQLQSILRIA
jgi:hypothetical protein